MTAEFYMGSYAHQGEEGILRFHADFTAGRLTRTLTCAQAECPSYLLPHPNGAVLYAVRELTDEGGLYAFAVEGSSLRLLRTLPTLGKDPCYLSLDESLRFLFVANYTGGSISVFRLDEHGVPGEMTDHIAHIGSGPDPVRQEAAHPHCAVPVGGVVFVCDLGMDRIFRYRLNAGSGKLSALESITMPPGSGPRHLCPSPADKHLLYVVGELSSKVYVFRLENGGARLVQELSTLPASFTGKSIAAALKPSADGGALFVSNRGDDSIALFRILPDGLLELRNICKTGGNTPRDFSVFGEYLVAANQDSDLLTVLKYDGGSFRLLPHALSERVIRPTQIAPPP